MNSLTSVFAGLILMAIGVLLSAAPLWHEAGIDAANAIFDDAPSRTQEQIDEATKIYDNDSLVLTGLAIAAIGFIYCFIIPIYRGVFSPSFRFLLTSTLFFFFTMFPGIIFPDWFIGPITFVGMMIASILFIIVSPFFDFIYEFFTGTSYKEKQLNDASTHINKTFSIMMRQKNEIKKMQKTIDEMKLIESTTEFKSDDLSYLFKLIDKKSKISILTTLLLGILAGIMLTQFYKAPEYLSSLNSFIFRLTEEEQIP